MKSKKPKNIKLDEKWELEVGYPGTDIIYLKPDEDTYIWIEKMRKIRAIHKWLGQAIAYLEQQKRETKNG